MYLFRVKSFSYFVDMKSAVYCIVMLVATGCSLQKNSVISDIKDDNSFVYSLPYEKGKTHMLVQGYMSTFSHKGEYALDFKMKKGTKICAARSGIVIATREDSKLGGYKDKYLSEGNYIIIKHDDGTYANYWHLNFNGALVNRGDTVQQGQVIGLSGNTGYSAFPHLHFEVTTQYTVGHNQSITRFRTNKGVTYLKPLHRYKAI
jgi:murein DD-endopeptidase MepM/ murein hydrolase activator NlpD